MKKCFYEILGVDQHASEDEIKKSYRRLALKFHPDKNPDDSDAHAQFLAVQEAYETLSDQHERAWYDGHKSKILRNENVFGNGVDPSADRINIYRWFRVDCFNGFTDQNEKCFYTVYRSVFDIIADEEVKRTEDPSSHVFKAFQSPPSFGTSTSSIAEVNEFYRFWSGFITQRSFAFAGEWNLRDAPNRIIRRQMEAENKRKRTEARKEFVESVRELVLFVKRRDPRVASARLEKAAEAKRITESLAQTKESLAAEYKRLKEIARNAEIKRMERLKEEKAAATATSNQVFLDDSEESSSEGQPSTGGKKKLSKKSNIVYVCEACRKTFRSEGQFKSHEKSKKHVSAVAELIRSLDEEEKQEDLSDSENKLSNEELHRQNEELETEMKSSEPSVESGAAEDTEVLSSSTSAEIKSTVIESDNKSLPFDRTCSLSCSNVSNPSDSPDSSSECDDEGILERLRKLRLNRQSSDDELNEENDESLEAVDNMDEGREDGRNRTVEKCDVEQREQVTIEGRNANEERNKSKNKKQTETSTRDPKAVKNKTEKCSTCFAEFDSRNQLFKHIKQTNHETFKNISISKKNKK